MIKITNDTEFRTSGVNVGIQIKNDPSAISAPFVYKKATMGASGAPIDNNDVIRTKTNDAAIVIGVDFYYKFADLIKGIAEDRYAKSVSPSAGGKLYKLTPCIDAITLNFKFVGIAITDATKFVCKDSEGVEDVRTIDTTRTVTIGDDVYYAMPSVINPENPLVYAKTNTPGAEDVLYTISGEEGEETAAANGSVEALTANLGTLRKVGFLAYKSDSANKTYTLDEGNGVVMVRDEDEKVVAISDVSDEGIKSAALTASYQSPVVGFHQWAGTAVGDIPATVYTIARNAAIGDAVFCDEQKTPDLTSAVTSVTSGYIVEENGSVSGVTTASGDYMVVEEASTGDILSDMDTQAISVHTNEKAASNIYVYDSDGDIVGYIASVIAVSDPIDSAVYSEEGSAVGACKWVGTTDGGLSVAVYTKERNPDVGDEVVCNPSTLDRSEVATVTESAEDVSGTILFSFNGGKSYVAYDSISATGANEAIKVLNNLPRGVYMKITSSEEFHGTVLDSCL